MGNIVTRVVLITSQDIGYQLGEFFIGREDIDLFVVTQRTERDELYGYRSVIDLCEERSVPFVVSGRIGEGLARDLEARKPDIIVCAYYPHLLPASVISLAPKGAVNIHPGILPQYRGRFPTPWYILNGEKQFGVAIHRLEPEIDSGDVLVQELYDLRAADTGHSLYRRTMDLGAALLIKNFDRILRGEIAGQPQAAGGSYFRNIEGRFEIDWNLSRETIERRVRVHARPYLPAFTFVFNRMIQINRVSLLDLPGYSAQGGGRIVEVWPDGRFAVSCSDGCIRIEEYFVCPPFEGDEAEKHIFPGALLG